MIIDKVYVGVPVHLKANLSASGLLLSLNIKLQNTENERISSVILLELIIHSLFQYVIIYQYNLGKTGLI